MPLPNLPLGEIYGALFFAATALLAWGAAAVLLEPTVLLLANEWQLGRVSGAVLGATLVVLIVAVLLFGGTLPLLRVGTWSMQWLLPCSVFDDRLVCGMVNAATRAARRVVPRTHLVFPPLVFCPALAGPTRQPILVAASRLLAGRRSPALFGKLPIMTVIERSALLPYAAEQVFDLVADIERYPEFLEGCVGAEIHERGRGDRDRDAAACPGPRISHGFTTRNTMTRPEKIELTLVDGPFDSFSGRVDVSRSRWMRPVRPL